MLYDENEEFDQAEYEQWLDEVQSADDDERAEWFANCEREYFHDLSEAAKLLAGGLIA
jgi:hypothetical protein